MLKEALGFGSEEEDEDDDDDDDDDDEDSGSEAEAGSLSWGLAMEGEETKRNSARGLRPSLLVL